MKLNLGCGSDKRGGYLNVDQFEACDPDLVLNLEDTPWPWPDNSVDEVLMVHVLEHLGRDTDVFLNIITEIWRVLKHRGAFVATVPHPRHNHYLADPTHVRPILAQGLILFDQRKNKEAQAAKKGNTPLGLYLGIDLEIEDVKMVPDDMYKREMVAGRMTQAQLVEAERLYNNVISEMTIRMTAHKPARVTK